ncbi:MAG: TetR/AcrR family transcriptional regulator [Methylocystis sp.]|nr:TetR/AcrR family transcriptional regulator [Methylocystis sp.]
MSRFKKDDWLALGARLLAQEGPEALTLERLTAAAKRTRGSFYHHFSDRDAFVRAMMERWRRQVIDEAGKRYADDPSPKAWRALLREAPFEIDYRFERAVRRLAAVEPIARAILEEVDRARIDGLAWVIGQLRPEVDDPAAVAFIQYAVVVGGQWLLDDPNDPRIPAIRKTGDRLFGIDEPEDG